jgi:hypothetical protein
LTAVAISNRSLAAAQVSNSSKAKKWSRSRLKQLWAQPFSHGLRDSKYSVATSTYNETR